MNHYPNLIAFGKANNGKHPVSKKGDKHATALAKAFQALAKSKRNQLIGVVEKSTPVMKIGRAHV